jgi:hypothetical protein
MNSVLPPVPEVSRPLGTSLNSVLPPVPEVSRPLGTSLNSVLPPVPEVSRPLGTSLNSVYPSFLNESVESNDMEVENESELEEYYTKRVVELEQRSEKCKEECEQFKREQRELEDILTKKKIDGILLSTDKKLIDLLTDRILDTSPEWRQKIDRLINIPTSIKGNLIRGGDYFEALFQLAIAIGIMPVFKNTFVRFYDIKKYKNLFCIENYLYEKSINNSGGAEQGISDITFETFDSLPGEDFKTNKNPLYFITVKGYKKEKSIKNEYDIPLLFQQMIQLDENKEESIKQKKKHIIVCVRNKETFLENLSRTKMDFLKHSIHHVFGYDEMMDAFSEFRCNFLRKIEYTNRSRQSIVKEVRRLFPNIIIQKQPLSLYFHQELIVTSVIQRIQEEKKSKPHFLCIGVLPRGGKSFIAGGIIDAHKQKKDKKGYHVLFLTSAVNETKAQFREDLIQKYSEFSDFEFIDVVNHEGKIKETMKENKFYFISRQLAGKKEVEKDSENDEIENISKDMLDTLQKKLNYEPKFDIIFFDEAHIGISSTTVKRNFQKAFEKFNTPIILMTATYKKPANLLDSNKDLFIWDLQDVLSMRTLPVLNIQGFMDKQPDLFERYPDTALSIIEDRIKNGESLEQLSRPYVQFPTPNFISLTFTPETIEHLKTNEEGYEFTKAFELNIDTEILLEYNNYSEWHKMIRNREHAIRIRQFLTPEQDLTNEDDMKYPFLQDKHRKYRALNQIFSIAQKNGSRPIQGKPFSILMFLPFNFGEKTDKTKIGELCRVWASFMMQSTYWKENFVFLTLSPFNHEKYKKDPTITIERAVEKGICHRQDYSYELKELILKVEKEAYRKGKGLVILSGDVAKMGISLKNVDVVFLMTNDKDADDFIQKMYRALTDDPPTKKDGFIVDLDLKRIIHAMYEYDVVKDKMRITNQVLPTTQERIHKIWELCNWGQDSFIEEHSDMNFNDIMNEIKVRVLNDLTKKIEGDHHEIVKTLEIRQKEQFRENLSLYQEIKEVLKHTKGKKARPRKEDIVMKTGETIPGTEKKSKKSEKGEGEFKQESDEETESHAEKAPSTFMLNDVEIEKKMFDIVKTFINAIVYKSTEPWNTNMNLYSLIEKYKKDKLLLKGKIDCNCNSTNKCVNKHDNLYEIAFCELSTYAMVSNSNQYTYDEKIHIRIMKLIEEVMKNSSLFVDWNIYIENLLKEIHTSKRLTDRK